MRVFDIIEYVILLVIVLTLIYNPLPEEKQQLLYIAALGFFLFSGASWAVKSVKHFDEMRRYGIWLEAIAAVIAIIIIVYVWWL